MGKNKRAAKAARAAAAAATTTSSATPLVTAITSAAPVDAHDSRAPAPAPTQQQHDVHAQIAPRPSSVASHTASTSSNDARSSSSIPAAPSATERERHRRTAANAGDACKTGSADTHTAAPTVSPASHTSPVSSSNTPTRCSDTTRPRAAENELEEGSKPREDEVRATRDTHGGDPQPVRTPALPQATTPRASHTPPPSTKRPRAAKNESNGLVGAREGRAHASPARTTPHAPPSAQHAPPCTHREAPASAHNNNAPPTPGFEPGKPQKAAASEEHEEPALLDASHVDELVATALRKGYDAGLKEGRNTGFREGLQAGRTTGVASGKELGYEEGKAAGLKEGREQGRLEVSTTVRVPSAVQPDVVPLPHPVIATSPTDHAPAVPDRSSEPTPALADSITPSPRLAMTLDAVDPRLLQDVRGASYDRGYDAGYHDGASDTCENLEWRLEERHSEGYSQGKEDGLRQLKDEQCDARKKIEDIRFWEGFSEAQQLYGARAMLPAPERIDAATQTSTSPVISCVDAPAQTDPPSLRVDAASQVTPDITVNTTLHENNKNMSSQCDVFTTMTHDTHESVSATVHH